LQTSAKFCFFFVAIRNCFEKCAGLCEGHFETLWAGLKCSLTIMHILMVYVVLVSDLNMCYVFVLLTVQPCVLLIIYIYYSIVLPFF